jgi:hypothetical protein
MKDRFTISEITKSLLIPRERFKEWLLRGYIKGSIKEPQGSSRTLHYYSLSDAVIISVFKKMLDIGVSRNVAKLCIWSWFENPGFVMADDAKYMAFIKWPAGSKQRSPGRIVSRQDANESFNSLFVDVFDGDPFESIHLIDLEAIRTNVVKRLSLIA